MLASDMPNAMASLSDAFESAPLTQGMDQVRELAQQSVRDNFTSSATPEGQSWPARKHVGDGHPLLIETGDLLQSAVGSGSGRIVKVEGREFSIGSSVKYAGFHQRGTSKMPARPFMGMREVHQEQAEEIIADEVMREVFDA